MEKHDVMDVVKVGAINSATLGVVTLSDAETLLKIVLLAITIAYTAYKFYLTHKNQSTETQWNRKEDNE